MEYLQGDRSFAQVISGMSTQGGCRYYSHLKNGTLRLGEVSVLVRAMQLVRTAGPQGP